MGKGARDGGKCLPGDLPHQQHTRLANVSTGHLGPWWAVDAQGGARVDVAPTTLGIPGGVWG